MNPQTDDRKPPPDDDGGDPLQRMGMTLACAIVAQVVSVILAALLASRLPGGYSARAWSFLAGVVWTGAGTVFLVLKTWQSQPAARDRGLGGLRPARIAMWIVSSWVWPILVRWTGHRPSR